MQNHRHHRSFITSIPSRLQHHLRPPPPLSSRSPNHPPRHEPQVRLFLLRALFPPRFWQRLGHNFHDIVGVCCGMVVHLRRRGRWRRWWWRVFVLPRAFLCRFVNDIRAGFGARGPGSLLVLFAVGGTAGRSWGRRRSWLWWSWFLVLLRWGRVEFLT